MSERSANRASKWLGRHIKPDRTRRLLLGGVLMLPFLGKELFAKEDVIELNWTDLLPTGKTDIPDALQGIIQHDSAPLASQQPKLDGLRTDWNGKIVRIPGYIVPIDYNGTGVTAFILVPFVGACVHVPPPPANQLIFVTTADPYESSGLFEPVNVTGVFGAAATATRLAEIGYALSADLIEPFG